MYIILFNHIKEEKRKNKYLHLYGQFYYLQMIYLILTTKFFIAL